MHSLHMKIKDICKRTEYTLAFGNRRLTLAYVDEDLNDEEEDTNSQNQDIPAEPEPAPIQIDEQEITEEEDEEPEITIEDLPDVTDEAYSFIMGFDRYGSN